MKNKTLGRFIGLILATLVMGAGLTGTIVTINTIEATAEPLTTWIVLGATVVTAAFGIFALILWGDVDDKRQEAKH